MKYVSGIVLILAFPVLIIGALYLWRKRAALARLKPSGTMQGTGANQTPGATKTIADISSTVKATASAATALSDLFKGLVSTSNDYTPDNSEYNAYLQSSGDNGI